MSEGIVQEALAGLVHQFADPMACFRELVQNAIDANSTEIDVRFGHEQGRLIIDVDDFGDGMDRRIIDTKLTRLFSSSKDDDRTKIGRFGIGFVSVFALAPEVIRLDTSRAGEHWRVIFHPDRTFTRVARPDPVDGTKLRIYKTATAEEARDFAARARQAIAFWCRHVPAEIRVDGRPINEPFALQLPCAVKAEVGEARIVAGYSRDGSSFVGYYNRGLTLLEEQASAFPGVHVKLWSPELEHTMTRDNVLRDAGFDRVMASAAELVRGPLRARLLAVLAEQVPDVHGPGGATEHLYRALAGLVAADEALPRGAKGTPLVRLVDGSLADLNALTRAGKRGPIYAAVGRSRAGDLLRERGALVVAAVPGSAVYELVRVVSGATPVEVRAVWCATSPTAAGERPEGWPALQAALRSLAGVPLRGVELGSVDDPESPAARRALLVNTSAGGLVPLVELGRLVAQRWLVVNAKHPAVAEALALAPREPEFAAAALLKLFWLDGQDLTTSRASALTTAALELRCRRRTT